MPHTLPYSINAGDEILAEVLQAMFQSLSDKFSAHIVGADIDPNANIAGTCLAANTLPSDRLMAWNAAETDRLIADAGLDINKLKVTVFEQAGSHAFGATLTAGTQTAYAAAEISGGNWRARVGAFAVATGVLGHGIDTVTPSTPFASSAYELLAVYARDPVISGTNVNYTVRFVFISKT